MTGAFFREDGSYETPSEVEPDHLAPAGRRGARSAGAPAAGLPTRAQWEAGGEEAEADGEEVVGVHTSLLGVGAPRVSRPAVPYGMKGGGSCGSRARSRIQLSSLLGGAGEKRRSAKDSAAAGERDQRLSELRPLVNNT